MDRIRVAVAILALVLFNTAVAIGAGSSRENGIASVRTADDVVLGESDQRFEVMRVAGYDEAADELVIEINVTVLEHYGVDIGGAGVTVPDGNVEGASLTSARVVDGVVTLVLTPEERGIFVSEFWLTGLDTSEAETATDLTYDVTFSAGDGGISSFDVIDPDDVTPTASTETLVLDAGTQRVTVERLQPTTGNVTIELDLTVLDTYGISFDDIEAELESDEALVHELTVSDGGITAILAPANDTELFDVVLKLSGFEPTSTEDDGRIIASDITYGIRLAGVADGSIDPEPFDVITHRPTPHADDSQTSTPIHGSGTVTPASAPAFERVPGFGPLVALVGIVVFIGTVARRR